MTHALASIFADTRWLIEPTAMLSLLQRAEMLTDDGINAAVAAYQPRPQTPTVVGDVAVLDITGPISYKSSLFSMLFGGASIADLQAQFRAALADPNVRSILLRVDSPGGSVDMVAEFADEIFAARAQKQIVAVADPLVASAALWLAAQASVLYVSTSALVGSVGVFTVHQDVSEMLKRAGVTTTMISYGEHKVDGNPFEPLTDEARADLQAQVDAVGREFDAAMARGRGVSAADVRESFGQGRIFRGRQAIAAGLADKMGTFNQVLGKVTRGRAGVVAYDSTATLHAETTDSGDENLIVDGAPEPPSGPTLAEIDEAVIIAS